MKIINFIGVVNFAIPQGWPALFTGVVFLRTIQLIRIGVLGEYIGKIFMQVKCRPDCIIKEEGLDIDWIINKNINYIK